MTRRSTRSRAVARGIDLRPLLATTLLVGIAIAGGILSAYPG